MRIFGEKNTSCVIFCRFLSVPMADTIPNMADYSTPFADNSDTDTPWGALTSALTTHGVLIKSDGGDGEEEVATEVRTCTSCADLLLPPSSSADADTNSTDGDDGNNTGGDIPLLLVLISGSWCTPCKNFTPVLASCSPLLTNHSCTVLFLSADADLSAFERYFATMPQNWRALPYGEDGAEGIGEDDRDDLMEALGAGSLPTLVVLDPLSTNTAGGDNSKGGGNRVVVPNAVREVQAAGEAGMERLIAKWRALAAANRQNGGGGGTANAIPVAAATTEASAEQHGDNDCDDDEDESSLMLRYSLPDSTPALLCQYFRTQLLSLRLPPSLSTIILRREDLTGGDDAAALEMAEGVRTNNTSDKGGEGEGEMWAFRTAAPALPLDGWGGSLGLEAGAIECWEIERDGGDDKDDDNCSIGKDDDNNISRAVVTIENETGRYLLIFRETIVMERPSNSSSNGTTATGCEVTKTLNLDGVPAVARGAFARRWRRESEAIFHALLGTCDRRKMMGGSGGG